MVLVKAAPVLTSELDESMCVAAMTLDDDPRWIRLYPVPFRDLADDSKFKKYQEIGVTVIRSTDRRPESWEPIEGSISLGPTVGTQHGWSTRRERVEQLGEHNMCELRELNRSGSRSKAPSLAVVRVVEAPELIIALRDSDQIKRWNERAAAIVAQPSLFDDPDANRRAIKVVPWRFSYRYRCLSPTCSGHQHTIVDWEAVALWRKVRHFPDWQDRMREKFVGQLWAQGRDTVLFTGNMAQYPGNFLVLGVFWPPTRSLQRPLFS